MFFNDFSHLCGGRIGNRRGPAVAHPCCIASSDRKSTILKHRSSKKHINSLTETEYVMQTFLTDPVEDLIEKKAFYMLIFHDIS